ncbi:protein DETOXIFICATION 16-like isoform X1 [Miscanthus floridulus]|uniref:protein DETOXIFICATION 16-like isoform X1 n=1 Tax=Miscanthus floridulus TaxID=154761 RepID=UPI0034593A26
MAHEARMALLETRPPSVAEGSSHWFWCWQGLAGAEAKRLARLAGPMVASCFLQNAVNVVSLMFVGHLGELHLAGASLAISVTSATGLNIIIGMAFALDTLCGQAFGVRQYHLLGVYKQRAMLVIGLACVPFAFVWANAGRILVFLRQDPAVAYARWLMPSLALYVPLQCHVRFLQTQSLVLPVMASSGATTLCHLAVCWALVHKAGMGSKGAALSNAVSYGLNLVILALYVRLSGACERTWNGFSVEGFKELRQFANLAVPSAFMICVEFWAFEIIVLLSGLLPNPQLETSVLSICTRVSNKLGAGQPQAAKLAMRVVMCMALSSGFILPMAMILLRSVWGQMYRNEQEVVAYIAKMMPVLGISFFIDGLHGSLSGVLTGCGKQKIGAVVNLGAFYLAGIPMAVLLAFVFHMNGMGLWLGMVVCGSLTKALSFASVAWFIDWNEEAVKAKDRVFTSSLPVAHEI